jgi:hypothetical protein
MGDGGRFFASCPPSLSSAIFITSPCSGGGGGGGDDCAEVDGRSRRLFHQEDALLGGVADPGDALLSAGDDGDAAEKT